MSGHCHPSKSSAVPMQCTAAMRGCSRLDMHICSQLPLCATDYICSRTHSVRNRKSLAGPYQTYWMHLRRLLLDHLDVVWSGDAQSIAIPQDASLVTHAAKVRDACAAYLDHKRCPACIAQLYSRGGYVVPGGLVCSHGASNSEYTSRPSIASCAADDEGRGNARPHAAG